MDFLLKFQNMQKKKLSSGKEIEYLDVIHHRTITHISFWDRVKILLGRTLMVESEIYTKEVCNVVASESKPHIPPLFKKKLPLGRGMIEKLQDAGAPSPSVFFRPECTYNVCPDTDGCNKKNKCRYPR